MMMGTLYMMALGAERSRCVRAEEQDGTEARAREFLFIRRVDSRWLTVLSLRYYVLSSLSEALTFTTPDLYTS